MFSECFRAGNMTKSAVLKNVLDVQNTFKLERMPSTSSLDRLLSRRLAKETQDSHLSRRRLKCETSILKSVTACFLSAAGGEKIHFRGCFQRGNNLKSRFFSRLRCAPNPK